MQHRDAIQLHENKYKEGKSCGNKRQVKKTNRCNRTKKKERKDTVLGIQEKTAMFYIAALFVFIPLVMAIVIMQPCRPTYLTHNAVLVLLLALWCATIVSINTAELNKHRQLKLSLILSLLVTFATPLPHILCYSALGVSSNAKNDRHSWIERNCR